MICIFEFFTPKNRLVSSIVFRFSGAYSLRVFVSREQLFQQREKLFIEQGKWLLFKKHRFIIKKLIRNSNTKPLNHRLPCNCLLCNCPLCNCLTVQMDHCAQVGAPFFLFQNLAFCNLKFFSNKFKKFFCFFLLLTLRVFLLEFQIYLITRNSYQFKLLFIF